MSPDNPNMKIVPERDHITHARSSGMGSSGGTGALWGAVVVLVAGIAGVYYQNTQLSDKLVQQNSSLVQATQRIQLLEDELTATGRDLSKSGSTLEKRIEDAELEIRKLWDLSNKRNRTDIAQNEKELKELAKRLTALAADMKEQQVALTDEMSTRDNMDKALQTEQQVLNERLITMQSELADHKNTLNALLNADIETDKQLGEISKKLSKIDSKAIQNVEKTLKVYDERLDAIDASRRQLTSNVTRLNTDVNNLQLEVNALIKAGQSTPSTATAPAAQ